MVAQGIAEVRVGQRHGPARKLELGADFLRGEGQRRLHEHGKAPHRFGQVAEDDVEPLGLLRVLRELEGRGFLDVLVGLLDEFPDGLEREGAGANWSTPRQ